MATVFAVAIFILISSIQRCIWVCVENLKIPAIHRRDRFCCLKKITFAALNNYDE